MNRYAVVVDSLTGYLTLLTRVHGTKVFEAANGDVTRSFLIDEHKGLVDLKWVIGAYPSMKAAAEDSDRILREANAMVDAYGLHGEHPRHPLVFKLVVEHWKTSLRPDDVPTRNFMLTRPVFFSNIVRALPKSTCPSKALAHWHAHVMVETIRSAWPGTRASIGIDWRL